MKLLFITLCSITLLSSCELGLEEKLDEVDLTQYSPYLIGREKLHETYMFHKDILLAQDNVILTHNSFDVPEWWIAAYDKNTLEKVWHWQDIYDEHGELCFFSSPKLYHHGNVLVVKLSNLSYGIDVNTGETLWKQKSERSQNSVMSGCQDKIISFYRSKKEGSKLDSFATIQIASMHDGEWSDVFVIESEYIKFGINIPVIFEWMGIWYIAVIAGGSNDSYAASIREKLYLYNLTENRLEWKSETLPLTERNLRAMGPYFKNGKLIVSKDAIFSYDLKDGTLIWSKAYDKAWSSLVIDDDVLYFSDRNDFLIGLDLYSGALHCKINIPNLKETVPIIIQNESLYLGARNTDIARSLLKVSEGKCHVEAEIVSPFYERDGHAFEENYVVDPETGIIYICDHYRLLAFDLDSEGIDVEGL